MDSSLRWVRTTILGVGLGLALVTAACGQKGPLYVPGVPTDASWPYPKPAAPATAAAAKKTPDVPARSDAGTPAP